MVDGVDPDNSSGLRADLVIDVPVDSLGGCDKRVKVIAMISGTPEFWREHGRSLRGRRRVGIGLRTAYDHASYRVRDYSGYQLPRDIANVEHGVENPDRDRRVRIERRDAAAAATGQADAFGVDETPPGAVTFGRVIVRTNGRIVDGEARPRPDFTDGNPWVSGLGDVGEEAAVWRCQAGPERAQWPRPGVENPASQEVALGPDASEGDTCAGLAVIEARGADTFRDAALLIVGGIFSMLFGALVKGAYGAFGALRGRGAAPGGNV